MKREKGSDLKLLILKKDSNHDKEKPFFQKKHWQ